VQKYIAGELKKVRSDANKKEERLKEA